MTKKTENHLRKLINDRCKGLNKDDYFNFCINYAKDHIINHRYNSTFTANTVIDYWFKKGMAAKFKLDHQK